MVNLSRRFKLEYFDGTNTQIIAETGQDTGAAKIDNHTHFRRVNDPDVLKVHLEGKDLGNNVPTRISEFGDAQNNQSEPEILYKQYDEDSGSFVTKGRFYAKNSGTINENGELSLKLYSFMKYVAGQQVDIGSVTTNIEDALNQILPAGYVADVPSSVTPPNVDNYSLNARREKGFQELTRNYNYALTFTAELDGNNDYKVKFEPVGQGGTVDTLVGNSQAGKQPITGVDTGTNTFIVQGDVTNQFVINQNIEVAQSTGNDGTYTIASLNYNSGNNETDIGVDENVSDTTADGIIIPGGQAKFKYWRKDKTDSIVNKVTVEGTKQSDNTTVTGTAENTAQINEFGEKFKKLKVGYLDSQAEAERIAENYLVPGKDDQGNDITSVPESGKVKTTVYTDNVVNDSFQVVDSKRNIDDTFTVVKQINFWPEGASKLEFEFESERLEGEARDKENLRDERARLYPTSQTDVGNQNVDANTEDVTGSYDSFGNDNHPHGNPDSTSDNSDINTNYNWINQADAILDGETLTINQNAPSVSPLDYYQHVIHVVLGNHGQLSTDFDVELVNSSQNVQLEQRSFFRGNVPGSAVFLVSDDFSDDQDGFELNITNNTGADAQLDVTWTIRGNEKHFHNVPLGDTDQNTTGGTNATNSSDPSAGDTTSLNASGSTDAKNVNVATEDKTDR